MELLDTLHLLVGRHGDEIAWWQMCVRATVVFFYGLVLLRLAHKRAFGRWSALDIILSVVIGSNLSRTLTGNAPFLETLLATTLLVGLHGVLVSIAARVPALGPLLKGASTQLIRDGEVDRKAMHKHAVGEHDLQEALRSSGLDDASQARAAYIERSGDISVLKR